MTDQLFTGSYPSDALTEAKQLRAENEALLKQRDEFVEQYTDLAFKYADAANHIADHLDQVSKLMAENERLRAALTRLSTAECFGNGAILGQHLPSNPFGQEIVARMNFARAALQEGQQCTPTT